jgi:uncharacterized protein
MTRFASLPCRVLPDGRRVFVARSWRARLLGLAGLTALPPDVALLLPACRSVHTFGMRFALDLVWVDARGAVVRVDRDVAPCSVRSCAGARAVIEAPAGEGGGLARAWASAHRRDDRHDEHGGQDERDQRPHRDRHGGHDDQRHRGGSSEGSRREPRIVVGQR